jgi:CTP-dependent riboflavin kinase
MLASTDENGCVVATLSKLARDARVDPEDCQKALNKFLSPDAASLTRANEGRRIEVIEGGWRLLNHLMYRDMMNAEAKREYFRNKRREYRQRERDLRKGMTIKEIVKEKASA